MDVHILNREYVYTHVTENIENTEYGAWSVEPRVYSIDGERVESMEKGMSSWCSVGLATLGSWVSHLPPSVLPPPPGSPLIGFN